MNERKKEGEKWLDLYASSRVLEIETCEPIQLNHDSRVHALQFERHWNKAKSKSKGKIRFFFCDQKMNHTIVQGIRMFMRKLRSIKK